MTQKPLINKNSLRSLILFFAILLVSFVGIVITGYYGEERQECFAEECDR